MGQLRTANQISLWSTEDELGTLSLFCVIFLQTQLLSMHFCSLIVIWYFNAIIYWIMNTILTIIYGVQYRYDEIVLWYNHLLPRYQHLILDDGAGGIVDVLTASDCDNRING